MLSLFFGRLKEGGFPTPVFHALKIAPSGICAAREPLILGQPPPSTENVARSGHTHMLSI
jgi:hypothetical protein